MQSLGVLLKPFIREHQLEPGLLLLRLQSTWAERVGAPIAAHSFPMTIRRETLVITVDSSVWSQELSMLREELLRKVNSEGRRPVLHHIRLYVGDLPRLPPCAEGKTGTFPITEIESAWLQAVLIPVAEPQLKEQIRRALRRALARGCSTVG